MLALLLVAATLAAGSVPDDTVPPKAPPKKKAPRPAAGPAPTGPASPGPAPLLGPAAQPPTPNRTAPSAPGLPRPGLRPGDSPDSQAPAYGGDDPTLDPARAEDWSRWWRQAMDGTLDQGPRGSDPGRALLCADALSKRVIPALLDIAASTRCDRDRGAALVALGRAAERASAPQRAVIRAQLLGELLHAPPAVRRAAALGLGIVGDPRDVRPLLQVMAGGIALAPTGAAAPVPATRVAAAYALALLVEGTTDAHAVACAASEAMRTWDAPACGEELRAAAATLLSHCTHSDPAARDARVRWLAESLSRAGRPGERPSVAHMHAFHALGALSLDAGDAARYSAIKVLSEASKDRDLGPRVAAARVLGLGEALRSCTQGIDARGFDGLFAALRSSEPLERHAAALALARASTRAARTGTPLAQSRGTRRTLERGLTTGRPGDRHWYALALGLYLRRAQALGIEPRARTLVKLRRAVERCRGGPEAGAFAVGAALAAHGPDDGPDDGLGDALLDLRTRIQDPSDRAPLFAALGLVQRGSPDEMTLALQAVRRGRIVRWHATRALEFLGRADAIAETRKMLAARRSPFDPAIGVLCAVQLGDARLLDPLLEIATAQKHRCFGTAGAIAALGALAARSDTDWDAPLARSVPFFSPAAGAWERFAEAPIH